LKRVIITGDDFGLALPVNEAIEQAHRYGVLTAASLMVGAAASEDAVERARRLPTLRVGLHLVLVEGRPVLRPEQVPNLVDERGEFLTNLGRAGFNFFFRTGARRELEAEIRAQFEAFKQTGLCMDHVNSHNHMHVHPTVLGLILKVGHEYGTRAVRLPYEPALLSWRVTRRQLVRKLSFALFLAPWLGLMRVRLRRAGIRTNDRVMGMADSGKMTTARVLEYLKRLPGGVTEIYFHPATQSCPEITRNMPDYRHEDEFKALMDPAVADTLAQAGARRISFTDLWDGAEEASRAAGKRGASGF
jgi:hopanoid biosynthesis associated protein HpnK